ncbi:hypothetical protein H4582DRAFT_2068199 [Lactarius indigo]|nr:hypothetical protein H4582DRAFT_2068199 [Lactarius indigo]
MADPVLIRFPVVGDFLGAASFNLESEFSQPSLPEQSLADRSPEETLFQLKSTAKSLSRQANKVQKDENVEKTGSKRQQGNNDSVRPKASNAIRKKIEALNLLHFASEVETAVTMRQVTDNITGVTKGMDKTMEKTNLEHVHLPLPPLGAGVAVGGLQYRRTVEICPCLMTPPTTPPSTVTSPERTIPTLAPAKTCSSLAHTSPWRGEARGPELKHHVEPAALAGWWSGLYEVYPRIPITAGKHEGLFDQIVDVRRAICQHVKDTMTVAVPGGTHEDMIIKSAVGQGGNCQNYNAIVAFSTRSFRSGN